MATLDFNSVIRTTAGGQTTSTIVTANNIGTYAVASSATYYIGTTQNVFNRASAAQTLTGVSIDGNAATVTNGVYTTGAQTIGGTKTFSDGVIVNGATYYTFNKPTTTNYQTVALFGSASAGLFLTTDSAIIGTGAYYNAGWIATATSGRHIDFAGGTFNFNVFSGATVGGTATWGSVATLNSSGTFSATGDFRAPVFYDTNNTAYYCDPASVSNLNAVTLNRSGSDGYLTLPGSVTVSNVSAAEMVIRGLSQLRFSNSTSWDWNAWAGLRYDNATTTIYLGGPAATGIFTQNATPPTVTVSFVGTNNVTSDSNFKAPIFYDSANTAYYLDPANTGTSLLVAGNVGIGTTSPTQKLDIVGSYGAADDNSGILKIRGPGVGPTQLNFGVSADGGYGWIQATDIAVDNDRNIILGPLGGNIGIGTTSPSNALYVLRASGDSSATFKTASGGAEINLDATNGYAALKLYSSGTEKWRVGQINDSTGFQIFQSGTGARVYVNSSGNVGIGTTGPSTSLQIGSGTPTAATNGIQFGDDTGTRIYRGGANYIQTSSGLQSGAWFYAATYIQTGGNLIYPSSYSATQRLEVGNVANNNWIDGLTIAPGGIVTAPNEMRSPIFYDSDNTAYYIDAASTSVLNRLNYTQLRRNFGASVYSGPPSGSNLVKTFSGVLVAGSANGSTNTYTVIETSIPQGNYQMGGFTINWFENYSSTNGKTTIEIAGYWNPTSNGGFIGFEFTSSNPNIQPTIQVGANASGNTVFILTHFSSNYPVIVARDLWFGYNSSDAEYGTGWTMTNTNSIAAYTNLVTATLRVGPTLTGTGASGTWGINITGNAANITAYTINQNLGTSNTPSFAGLVSSAITNYAFLQVTDTNNFWITPGNNNWGLYFETSAGGLLGGTGDSNRLGFVGSGSARFYVDLNNGNGWFGGSLTANTDSRAPIFYDSNNTAYYLDPNSSSNLNNVTVAGTLTLTNIAKNSTGPIVINSGQSASLGLRVYYDMNLYNTLVFTDSAWNSQGSIFGSSGVVTINAATATTSFVKYAGYSQEGGSFRAPIFYDSDNTAYYIDAAGTSVLNVLTVGGNNVLTTASTLTAGNLSGTIPSGVLGNSTLYVGTTAIALNRGSASQSLTGVNIDGNAGGSSTFVASLGSGLNYDIDRTTKRSGLSHYSGYSTGTNRPTTYDYTLQVTDGNKGWEISMDWIATTGPSIYARSLRDCCQNWSSWVRILDSVNYSYAYNMNQNVRTTDNVTFANVTGAIFYDAADSTYYLDPANTTLSLKTRSSIVINNASAPNNLAMLNIGYSGSGETRAIDIQGGWSGGENKSITFTHASSSTNIVAQINAQHNGPASRLRWGKLYHGGDSSTYTMELISESTTSAYLTVAGSVRAPIFYDSNDTNYYVDPASTSLLNATRSVSIVAGSNSAMTGSPGSLAVYSASSPYISFHDGGVARTAYLQEAGGRFYFGDVPYTESEGSFRAPLFYDVNDTNYYVDPASTSVMLYVRAANFHDSTGSYNVNLGSGNSEGRGLVAGYSGGSYGGIGYNVRHTTTGGSWIAPTADTSTYALFSNGIYFYYAGTGPAGRTLSYSTIGSLTSAGIFTVSGDSRAPIFYDSNDTSYYIDPASTSRVSTLYVANSIVDSSSVNGRILLYGNLHIDSYGSYDIYCNYYSGRRFRTFKGVGTGAEIFRTDTDGIVYAYEQLRTPVLYDYNDTTYYIDPASTSNIVELKTNKNWYDSSASIWGGGVNMAGNNPTIGFQSTSSTWWYMLHHASSAINFYRRSTSGSWNLDGIWDSSGNFIWQASSVRGQIFYDNNDTTYYVNPASASVLNSLTVTDGNLELYKSQTVDMSNTTTYSTSNYYPVTIPVPTEGCIIQIQNNLNSNVPSWATHGGGFTLNLKWRTNGLGWGTTQVRRIIDQYYESFTNQTICGGITQMGNSSTEVVWLRGGGQYYFKFSRNLSATAQSATYTVSSQSVSPTSTAQNTIWNSATGASIQYNDQTISTTNMYTPVLYDWNNTAYYVDPASTSNLVGLTVANTITGSVSGNAVTAGGLAVHAGTNNEANKIVRTDSNGYIQAGWINTTSGDQGTTAIDRVYASYDGYIRYYTPANFRTVLDVPTRGGSGASGSWGISITGNAATVTNGVYTTGAQYITAAKYFQSDLGTTSGSLSSPPLQAYASGTNAAFMSFHRGGSYAVNMGLDSDNVLRIGGWSASANRLQLDMSGNLTLAGVVDATQFRDSSNTAYYIDPASTSNLLGLTVTNTITGSVSGSAATATTATNAGCVTSDTGNVGDSRLQYWQTSGNTTLNPDTEWYNAIRMGHGNPVTYYSNTLAVKMTGSNLGDIYTRTTTNGTAGTWNRFWNNNNDGAGSGLDADLLDGINSASFLRSDVSATNSVDLRSPIFYDSNNTAYYIDGASGSKLKYLQIDGDWGSSPFGSGQESFTIRSTYASMCQRQTNGSLGYWLHHVASDAVYYLYGGRGATDGNSWDWSYRAYPNQDGSFVEFRTSARAPIFYDSNNTTYYIDPASTSVLNLVAANQYVQKSASQSLSGTVGCTIDVAAAGIHILNLASGTTISSITYNNRSNNPSVNTLIIVLKYSGTATITWTNVLWANDITPVFTNSAGLADIVMLTSYQGGAATPVWIGTVVAFAVNSTNL